jgi:transcriptional regulator with XRE-family HTH domain
MSKATLPLPVKRTLAILGSDIRSARRRRRIATAMMAERAMISRATLLKIEKGDPGVSMGSYTTVLYILGLTDALETLAAPENDPTGLALADEELPKRIRRRTRKDGCV